MAFKKIGKSYFAWGKLDGFALGISISKYFITIDLCFWYVGMEF